MPEAPSQQEWLDNRRSYSRPEGAQQRLVASLGNHLVGYACIEYRDSPKRPPPANKTANGEYRLFVVVAPSDRATVGSRLLQQLRRQLIELDARRAWMMEYEADSRFLSYLEGRGFVRQTSF